jgi:alpha-glucosidase
MPWDAPERWDSRTLELVRRLIALRHASIALRRGGLRWLIAEEDQIVLVREHPEERVLVQLTRGPARPVALDAALLGAHEGDALLDHVPLVAHGGDVVLPASDRASARMWRLPEHPDRAAT